MIEKTGRTKGLFITGTDTDVGKTYVATMIARQLVQRRVTVGAYKPACSGAEIGKNGELVWSDRTQLADSIGGYEVSRVSPQVFRAPLAPPVAAKLEGKQIDGQLLISGAQWWIERVDMLLVEGAGGLLCPLTETESFADLAADLGLPLIIVARLGLGTINHTLLTVEAAERRRLRIAGIILNEGAKDIADIERKSNPPEIAARCPVPLLGTLHRNSADIVRDGKPVEIDWLSLASTGRATGSDFSHA